MRPNQVVIRGRPRRGPAVRSRPSLRDRLVSSPTIEPFERVECAHDQWSNLHLAERPDLVVDDADHDVGVIELRPQPVPFDNCGKVRTSDVHVQIVGVDGSAVRCCTRSAGHHDRDVGAKPGCPEGQDPKPLLVGAPTHLHGQAREVVEVEALIAGRLKSAPCCLRPEGTAATGLRSKSLVHGREIDRPRTPEPLRSKFAVGDQPTNLAITDPKPFGGLCERRHLHGSQNRRAITPIPRGFMTAGRIDETPCLSRGFRSERTTGFEPATLTLAR